MPSEKDVGAVPITTEYQEDLIDWDDNEIESSTQGATASVDIENDTQVDSDYNVVKAGGKTILTPTATRSPVNADATIDANDVDATTFEYTEEHVQQAKGAVVWSVNKLIVSAPYLTSALRLNSVGDCVTVEVPLNRLNIEVSWKVISTYDEEVLITLQQPLDTEQLTFLTTELEFSGEVPTEAAPDDVVESIEQHLALSTNTTEASSLLCEAVPLPAKTLPTSAFSLANLPCKFGKHCAKGAACPFNHTIKQKLCVGSGTRQTSREKKVVLLRKLQ
jgi:hypothetical protein